MQVVSVLGSLYSLTGKHTVHPANTCLRLYLVFSTQLIGCMGFDANTTFLISMPADIVQVACKLEIPYMAQQTGRHMLSAVAATCLSLLRISLMAGLARGGPTAYTV